MKDELLLARTCPNCGPVRLAFEDGSPGGWDDPPSPARAYCPECGCDFSPTEEDLREAGYFDLPAGYYEGEGRVDLDDLEEFGPDALLGGRP